MVCDASRERKRATAAFEWLRKKLQLELQASTDDPITDLMLNESVEAIDYFCSAVQEKDEALKESLRRIALMMPMGHDGMDDLIRSALDAAADQADMSREKVRSALMV